MCVILKFTENSLVLTVSHNCLLIHSNDSISGRKLNTVVVLKTAIVTEWQKLLSQRFVDSIASTNGVVVLNVLRKNDGGYVEHCNLV